MSETLSSHEAEENPMDGLDGDTKARVEAALEQYLREFKVTRETIDEDVERLLSKLLNSGPELDPDVKRSLRKVVDYLLGIHIEAE